MAKGQDFERSIATKLSLWWTRGLHDDTIWRSSMSGGRATVRGRQGKRTTGHAGDLCSTGSQSAGLFRAFSFEVKCGYQHVTINDLIDRPKNAAFQKDGWDGWIDQAASAADMSGSLSWMIIHQRSRGARRCMAYMDLMLIEDAAPLVYEELIGRHGTMMIDSTVRRPGKGRRHVAIVAVRLDDLLHEHELAGNSFRHAVRATVARKKKP